MSFTTGHKKKMTLRKWDVFTELLTTKSSDNVTSTYLCHLLLMPLVNVLWTYQTKTIAFRLTTKDKSQNSLPFTYIRQTSDFGLLVYKLYHLWYRKLNLGHIKRTNRKSTYQTTGKRIAPQQSRSTRNRISIHRPYSLEPSSVDSIMMYATLARTWNQYYNCNYYRTAVVYLKIPLTTLSLKNNVLTFLCCATLFHEIKKTGDFICIFIQNTLHKH